MLVGTNVTGLAWLWSCIIIYSNAVWWNKFVLNLVTYCSLQQDCPNGRLTPAKFVDMYKMFFPSGNAEEFCDHVFRTFDMDKNGYIDFKVSRCGIKNISINVLQVLYIFLLSPLCKKWDSVTSQIHQQHQRKLLCDHYCVVAISEHYSEGKCDRRVWVNREKYEMEFR